MSCNSDWLRFLSTRPKSITQNVRQISETRSTGDALVVLTTRFADNLDAAASVSRLLFLDYTSAFNTINRSQILGKLVQNQDAPSWLLDFNYSYRTTRSQYVEYKGGKYDCLDCNVGVIQGAALSPFLQYIT